MVTLKKTQQGDFVKILSTEGDFVKNTQQGDFRGATPVKQRPAGCFGCHRTKSLAGQLLPSIDFISYVIGGFELR